MHFQIKFLSTFLHRISICKMECNKDEAVRAKTIAEKKLLDRDYNGANKFALKAQSLFPKLEGISQLLEVLRLYLAQEKRINGEVNYYAVFGVDSSADDDSLKKQYRRLALALHPDKNSSVGADGAFKVLSQAWAVLSDKDERRAYNLKLNIQSSNQTSSGGTSQTPVEKHGFPNFTGSFGSTSMRNKTTATDPIRVPTRPRSAPTGTGQQSAPQRPTNPIPPPASSHPETFWTLCNKCRMKYEYLKMYLQQTLECPRCKHIFIAVEIPAPKVQNRTPIPGTFPQSSGSGTVPPAPATATQAATCQPPNKRKQEVPKKTEVASASDTHSSGPEKEKPVKKRRVNTHSGADQPASTSSSYKPRIVKDLSQNESRGMLAGRAKVELLGHLNQWESSQAKNVEIKISTNDLKEDSVIHQRTDESRDDLSVPKSTLKPEKSSILEETAADCDADPEETVSMSVPDADFHNFDDDRVEQSFTANQVWAAYDDDDGMPRYYAVVHRVISRKPFKLQISWLNSKSTSEFGSLDWISCGFTKTSGEFRVGKYVLSKNLNSFSHPVKWKKGARGAMQIFPEKGDVWALYKNWSHDWSELTEDETIHQYELVIVLQDYNEDRGVLVAPLLKVAGFTSVFRQRLDQRVIQTIPRQEMFRFSHQVPAYALNGQEAQNALNGCYELDPAALPLELLKVITADEEAKAESEAMAKWTNSKPLLIYSRRRNGNNAQRGVDQSME
ncbi:hypothetical protein ACJIZ3_004461 [Penstemon smallii]|uniref:J domain-containing protein n=1 Tax=Penstemon smallii TaxID=265156 RepID=A0ABD3S255_9LAMI